MNRAYVSGIRFAFLTVVIFACFVVLLGRLVHLHLVEGEKLARIVEQNRERFQEIKARRGNIVDRRGNLLASTQAVYEIGVDPESVQPEDMVRAPEVASLLGLDPQEVWDKFEQRLRTVNGPNGPEIRNVRWAELADSVDEQTYDAVMALKIKAVYGNRKYERLYPSETLAAHVLGFVNKEDSPVSGIERFCDFYLAGQDGWRKSEKDGRRHELSQFSSREVEPRAGLNVELTLDLNIQHKVEQEIAKVVEQYKPKGVAVIVSEVATGQVLAMANYPTFNPNTFWSTPVDNLRNRAVCDIYEPGSTFKIVASSAALNEDLVTPESMYDCSKPTVEYRGRTLRLPSDSHALGELSVSDIVIKSSNRGAALLGLELGEDRLYDYAQRFGFGSPTGFPLDLEENGILHPVKKWDGLTITRLPMGHAVSATPMQVHFAMSAIANGGVLMKPQIVREVFDENGNTIVQFSPDARTRVVSSYTATQLTNMLAKVVSKEGTAKDAAIEDYGVAGKTGTTQKIVDGRYSSQHHVGSFVGFFPQSSPRLVITVVVDDPQLRGVGYGGVVAAPVFRNIAEHCIQHLGIPPEPESPLMALSEDLR
ncbi:peptidoglycan D,D-transpeptidase FtsI family protein [Cerasicoccus arenae]|uniref:Stage V sporulation protein D n=1 Tax=Cerasicoccus arenae TaxID=424488 RepID=A0A8J3DMF7_9BACT|nr:penicillin-binding protein 2 [Cerasicoccus arenae]MBK1856860.1 penicillin-binding protein 2 [Cerasicoccus arenae]GHC11341.1 stage V sporulation protein D [Cerasicoccus arenae]